MGDSARSTHCVATTRELWLSGFRSGARLPSSAEPTMRSPVGSTHGWTLCADSRLPAGPSRWGVCVDPAALLREFDGDLRVSDGGHGAVQLLRHPLRPLDVGVADHDLGEDAALRQRLDRHAPHPPRTVTLAMDHVSLTATDR
jgi:hypothetical protein